MKQFLLLCLVFIFSITAVSSQTPIRIDQAQDAPYNTAPIDTLVKNVLVTGCLKASNVTFSGDVSRQIGYFNRGDADFPFKEGIVLSTGDVVDGMGPNTSSKTTTEIGTAGDTELESIASRTVSDAAVLEFDFVPAGDMVTFSYIFASEEYPEYACSNYNDVFGFFVTSLESDGYGYVNENVAVLPDNSAVSINNVHGAGRSDGSSNTNSGVQYPNPNGCLLLDNPTTLFSENFSSSFGTNWTFPDGQAAWGRYSNKAYFYRYWDDQLDDYSHSMVSKSLSGVGYSNFTLSFDLALDDVDNTGLEMMSIEVYNGVSWSTLETIPNSGDISSTNYAYDISQYASGNQFQVRFRAHGADSYRINYWMIDNVEINAAASATSSSKYYSFNTSSSCTAENGIYYVDQSAYVSQSGTGGCVQTVTGGVENPNVVFENIEADGRTVKLTATFAALACAKYHIKLAVGDVGDSKWDSWVFLEANSFKSDEVELEGSSNGQMGGGVYGDTVVLFEGCYEGTFFRLSRGEDDNATQELPIDLDYLPVGVNGIQIGDPVSDDALPTTVIIPIGEDYVDIPFYAIEDTIKEDPIDNKVVMTFYTGCPCDLDISITELNFQIFDVPYLEDVIVDANNVSCSGEDNGVIIVNSTGGSGAFECTLKDSGGAIIGSEWQSGNTYTGLEPGTYSVTVRDAEYLYFCNSVPMTVENVKIEEGVAVFADAGNDTTICNGKSVTLSGSGGVEFSWAPAGWLDDPNVPLPIVTPDTVINAPFTRIFTLTTSAADGQCPETDSVSVTVNPTPSVSIQANGTTLIEINACPDDTTALEAIVSAETTTVGNSETYLWSTGETTPRIDVSPNATQTFEVEVTNEYGCSRSTSILITVYPFEVSVGGIQNNVCPDDQIGKAFITVSGNALNLPVSTVLTGPIGFVSQTIEFTEVGSQQVTGLKSGSYSVTGTSSAGGHCTSTDTFQIQSLDYVLPTASVLAPITIQCIGDLPGADISVVNDATDNCTENPVVVFVSDVSDGNTCPEVITRTYSVTDEAGNSIDVIQLITVDDTIAPTITCPEDIIISADAGQEYATVNIAIPATSDACGGVVLTNTFTAVADASGQYPLGKNTVTYTARDACDNESTCSFNVSVSRLLTDSVTHILVASATLHGSLDGVDVEEYGFCYSTDNDKAKLNNVECDEVKITPASIQSYSDLAYEIDVLGLSNRSAYYFRAYMKDAYNNYFYGEVVRFISEKRDFSLVLDGDGDALVIDKTATAAELNDWGSSDDVFSLEFWIKRNSLDADKQIIISNADDNRGYSLYLQNGDVVLDNALASTASSVLQIDDQDWHYVAVSYSAGEVVIYVDDSASAAQSIILTPPVDNNCFIGAAYGADTLVNAFNGHLDAMRFWNVALDAAQVKELAYDIIHKGATSKIVEGVGSGKVIPSLAWDNLTVSLGFNVMSTKESLCSLSVPFSYHDQTEDHDCRFFHSDARLQDDKVAFNAIAIGNAKPSPCLPRVNWRYNATDSVGKISANWGGYAYPGEGVLDGEYPDVSPDAMADDSVFCKYAIVGSSSTRPVVTNAPVAVQVLVDREEDTGTYYVDESEDSELTILQKIVCTIFGDRVDASEGRSTVIIEEGSMEVHEE